MAREKTIISMYPVEVDKGGKTKDIEYFAVKAINDEFGYKIDDAKRFSVSEIEGILKGSKPDLVVGVVPSMNSFNRGFRLPPVEPKKIPEIVKFEATLQIPFDINDVYWGWKLMTDYPNAYELKVGISAVKKEVVDNYFPFKKVNAAITVQEALPYLYQAPKEEKLEGIIAIGEEENTDFVVCKNGDTLWNRCILMGKKYIEKKEKGESKDSKLSELSAEIKRALGSYKSSNPNEQVKQFYSPNIDFAKADIKKIGESIEEVVELRNPYGKFGNTSIKDKEIGFVYAAAGALAAENAINLIGGRPSSLRAKTVRFFGDVLRSLQR